MDNNKGKGFANFIPLLIMMLILSVILNPVSFFGGAKELKYSEFMTTAEDYKYLESEMIVSRNALEINGIREANDKKESFKVVIPNTEENVTYATKILSDSEGKLGIKDSDKQVDWLNMVLMYGPLLIMIVGIFYFVSKSGGMGGGNNKAFEFTKSRAKVESDSKVRFSDVAGNEEEKEEVQEVIDYLKKPKKFTDMGAEIPKGILMVGPPGTGKTLLAKAVAGEANVPFFSISGSDFVEMFVGTGASRVRDMFKKAQQAAPCILFIDEIDAVGRQRGAGMGGGNDEREQTLNQLLVEMDGMGKNKGIVIMAATNRADVLDPALMRSGRFDRQITVSLPDKKGRAEILAVHARNKKLGPETNLEEIARRTPGFSGADLANLLNEAAILAVREGKNVIDMSELDEAIDRVMMGPAKKSRKYSDKEKRLVAYHEAGHAVIGIKLESADRVQKITIIPRGEAGGYNLMTPEEEVMFPTKKDLMAKITGLMGGRVAEEVVFDEITAGASNDIEKITRIAKKMVRSWGMSTLGPIQYDDGSDNVFLGRDYGSGSAYSDEIASEIDSEVRKIVNEAHVAATQLIEENRDLLDLIALTLIDQETITAEEIDNLVAYGSVKAPVVEEPKEDKPSYDEVFKEATKDAELLSGETSSEEVEENHIETNEETSEKGE